VSQADGSGLAYRAQLSELKASARWASEPIGSAQLSSLVDKYVGYWLRSPIQYWIGLSALVESFSATGLRRFHRVYASSSLLVGSLAQVNDNARQQGVVQEHDIKTHASVALPKGCFCLWVSGGYHTAESWLFELRDGVVVVDEPPYCCKPKALNTKVTKLVNSCL
jgi:hypothetical protein